MIDDVPADDMIEGVIGERQFMHPRFHRFDTAVLVDFCKAFGGGIEGCRVKPLCCQPERVPSNPCAKIEHLGPSRKPVSPIDDVLLRR